MIDYELAQEVAIRVAREAGEILRGWRSRSADWAVEYKSVRDPVTEADRCSEEHVVSSLLAAFPHTRVLSEEAGATGQGEAMWIVDPLDGTVNFMMGHPFYAVSIALVEHGRPVVGAVYAPQMDDLFSARRGGGAFRQGEPIRVSSREKLLDAVLGTGFAYNRSETTQNNIDNFQRLILACRGLRRCGSAALDLAYVAAGILDGFWELYLAPWDVAAGVLLVEEAQGRVTDFAGGGDPIFSQNIVASNGRLHDAIRGELTPFVDEDRTVRPDPHSIRGR